MIKLSKLYKLDVLNRISGDRLSRQITIHISEKAFQEIEKLRFKWVYGFKRSEFIRGLIEEVLGISEPRVTLLIKDRVKQLSAKLDQIGEVETLL